MSLPRKLKAFVLFNDGGPYLGEVPELTLPTLAAVMVDYRGGGMPGAVKMDMGLQPLTLEWKGAGILVDAIRQFGTARIDGVMLRMTGALQADDTEAITPVEVIMRGRHSEIGFGAAKAGELTELTFKTELSYYKLRVGGLDVVEVDMVNMVYIVGGVDRMAGTRAALGVI